MFKRHFTLTALAMAVAVGTAFGQSATISGDVRGADGKPVQGAQVRFVGKNHSDFATTTDRHGRYVYKNLAPGVYTVSVSINGTPKSSVTVKTAGRDARVDFDLKAAPSKSVKHLVWVPARTGSHMGGGWVEVDANGNPTADDSSNMQRASAEAVRDMQREMNRGTMPGDTGR